MVHWLALTVTLSIFYSVNGILDRDYYDYLDLPVSATTDQIREAFRRLSKKYHPDRNPGSKDRFEKINVGNHPAFYINLFPSFPTAYEILMDDHKKFLYDRLGKDKVNEPNIEQQYDFRMLKGPELLIKVNLPLRDFYLGKNIEMLVEKQVACPHCKGTGAENPYDIVNCHECGGKGKITRRVDLGNGFYNLYTNMCPRCEGKGKVIGRKCHLCQAQKIIQGIEEFNFTVAPGTPSGFISRYQNMGDERLEGAPSDILFQLNEIPHPKFRRVESDLHTTLDLTLREALLGFQKTIKHLDGRVIEVNSDEITQPGEVRTFEGEGMPQPGGRQHGNLFVTFNVHIPALTGEQLDVLEEFFQKHDIR